MKTIEIIGDNYSGSWKHTRQASRGIILENDKILLSYEKAGDIWMLPGGGQEENEDETACCKREIEEETGYVVKLSDRVLQINEYYEDTCYISTYFFGTVIGKGKMKLTEAEKKGDLRPEWISLQQAIDIFSQHAKYADTDEMKRGLYLREYKALSALIRDPD